MAERFNLTAQIQLQAPRNTSQIVGDIRKQLSGITANVKIKGDARTLAQINKQMQGVDKAASSSAKSVSRLNRNLSEAARRFSVITVATGTMLALARSIKNAVGEAIAFERELIKISQVTGKTVQNLQGLTREVTRLSTVWGASSKELLNVSRVLAQAGFSAEKTRKALDILAKTSLGATFNSLADTTEGAIAVLRQFRNEAKAAGGDIKFLEQTMDAINSVSKKFAVESGDLITVIRRVGGVFEAAGGKVNELIALFTSVRATTRESAETIATGLRTIFTRIQRTDTVDQLAALGIQLRNTQGQFVGAYEAVRRLSQGLSALDPRDFRFSEIVESLGGFRQIGKVIPLIRQFTTAQDALNVAQSSSGSVARDAMTAQKALAIQAKKVREEFSAMIRKFADSSTFRSVIKGALEMARAFIRIAEALEPLLPLLAGLAFMKIGSALAPGLGAMAGIGGKRKAGGGRIQGYARGGFVPGSGNRDTVPAMLQPGEFVIKQSSVKKIGAQRLAQMNGYAGGGIAAAGADDLKSAFNRKRVLRQETVLKGNVKDPTIQMNAGDSFSAKLDTQYLPSRVPKKDSSGRAFRNAGKQISDKKFEELAQRRFKGRKGGGGPLDLIGGDLPTEVKRTKGNVGDAILIDKLIRSFAKQKVSNEGYDSMLTGEPDDHLRLRGMRVVYSNQKEDLKPRTALSLGESVVQKRALGGIVKVNKVGAAILDEDMAMGKESVNVGIGDVNKHVGGSGFDKDIAQKGLGRVFKGKQYNILRQGLNKKTSEGFKKAILDGAASGVDNATSGLSSDLGLGQASLTGDGKSQLTSYLGKRGALVGDLYESALHSLNNRGAFKESQVSAPFDFPGGLSGNIRDNFDKLPSSWVDAKSSYAAAGNANMKGKIANEIADEYKRSGEYAKSINKRKKKSFGGKIDSVPALLTPGEYVINKSSAQSIGYGNLNKMNQTGAQRFATGGAVGWKRFAGGGPTGSGMGLSGAAAFGGIAAPLTDELAAVKKAMQGVGQEGEALAVLMGHVEQSLSDGKSPAEAFDAAFGAMLEAIEEGEHAAAKAKDLGPRRPDEDVNKYGTTIGVAESLGVELAAGTGQLGGGETSDAKAMLEASQTAEIQSIAKKIKAAEGEVGSTEALTRAKQVVRQKYGKLQTDIKAESVATEKLKQAKEAASKVQAKKANITKLTKKADKTSKTAGKFQKMGDMGAQASQMAFFGSAVAATAIQMSGLSDITKKAATETLAFATGLVSAGGMAIQMMSGLAQAAKASAAANLFAARTEKAESIANVVGTQTEATEAVADSTEAVASMAAAAPLLILVAVVLAVVLALKYFSSKARAEAEALSKSRTIDLEKVGEGGSGSGAAAERAKASIGVSLATTQMAEDLEATNGALIGATGGALAVAGAFALVGSSVPVIGTIIGALVGLGVGYYMATKGNTDAAMREKTAREEAIHSIHASIDSFHLLAKSAYEADTRLQEISQMKLPDTEEGKQKRIDMRQEAEAMRRVDTTVNEAGLGTDDQKLADLAMKKGKTVGSLSEDDFKAGSADLMQFKASVLKVEQSMTNLTKRVESTGVTLDMVSDMEIKGDMGFDELMATNSRFAKAVNDNATAIKDKAAKEISSSKASQLSAQAVVNSSKSTDEEKSAAGAMVAAEQEAQADIAQRANRQIDNMGTSLRMTTDAAIASANANKLAAAASAAVAARFRELSKATRAVAAVELKQANDAKNLSDKMAILTGGSMSFEMPEIQGLGDLGDVADVSKFKSDLNNAIGNLPPILQSAATKWADSASKAAYVMGEGSANVLKQFGKGSSFEALGVPVREKTAEKIAGEAGFKKGDVDSDIWAKMIKDIMDKAQDGLDETEISDIFGPAIEVGQAEGKSLQRALAIVNKHLDQYGNEIAYATKLEEMKAEKSKQVFEIVRQNVQNAMAVGGASPEEMQKVANASRGRQAQLQLKGTGVAAGDVAGAGGALGKAQQRLMKTQEKLEKIRNKTLSASPALMKDLMDDQKKQQLIIRKTTSELERLANQSNRAADIMSEIDKEKGKRDTVTGLITDFVVGGNEERGKMVEAFQGVNMAIGTGTLQNQSPEQRSATIGLLDKLSDIEIAGTGGMTGKDVKQELVFRDAIRMGLDPDIAEKLATATSKEQELINSLEHLSNVMEHAALEQERQTMSLPPPPAPTTLSASTPPPAAPAAAPPAAAPPAAPQPQQSLSIWLRRVPPLAQIPEKPRETQLEWSVGAKAFRVVQVNRRGMPRRRVERS